MKYILSWTFGLLVTANLFLAACQKKDDSAATAPTCSANLITPNCIPSNGFYPTGTWSNGSWYWPQGSIQPTNGNCGCNSGYAPAYGSTWGFACAPVAYMAQFPVTYFQGGVTNLNWGFWNSPAQNTQWLNIPQSYYKQCQNSTARGCDVRANNCPNGGYCQPVAGGSNVGLCVTGP